MVQNSQSKHQCTKTEYIYIYIYITKHLLCLNVYLFMFLCFFQLNIFPSARGEGQIRPKERLQFQNLLREGKELQRNTHMNLHTLIERTEVERYLIMYFPRTVFFAVQRIDWSKSIYPLRAQPNKIQNKIQITQAFYMHVSREPPTSSISKGCRLISYSV